MNSKCNLRWKVWIRLKKCKCVGYILIFSHFLGYYTHLFLLYMMLTEDFESTYVVINRMKKHLMIINIEIFVIKMNRGLILYVLFIFE